MSEVDTVGSAGDEQWPKTRRRRLVSLPFGDGTVVSNQGSISYDSDGNGTNNASALTDDPATIAANDPTSFTVSTAVAPVLQNTRSRKAHGGAGTFDLTLAP